MREIEKLFRKIRKKDRQMLLGVIERLLAGNHKGLDVKKLQGGDFYRMRTGTFRIIFHYDNGEVFVDSIRLRNDGTYKDF